MPNNKLIVSCVEIVCNVKTFVDMQHVQGAKQKYGSLYLSLAAIKPSKNGALAGANIWAPTP